MGIATPTASPWTFLIQSADAMLYAKLRPLVSALEGLSEIEEATASSSCIMAGVSYHV